MAEVDTSMYQTKQPSMLDDLKQTIQTIKSVDGEDNSRPYGKGHNMPLLGEGKPFGEK